MIEHQGRERRGTISARGPRERIGNANGNAGTPFVNINSILDAANGIDDDNNGNGNEIPSIR